MDDKKIKDIKDFLCSKHYGSRKILEKLKKEDVDNIRQIGAGTIAGVSRGDRIKALHVVAYLGRRQDLEILGNIIANDAEDVSLRAAAATNLAYLTPDIAESELIKYLGIRDDLIQSKVIKSLGMIGGLHAYEALSKLENISAGFVRKQLIFAMTLIAYRLNLDTDPLPFAAGAERRGEPMDELLELTVRPVGTRKIKTVMKSFEGSDYAVYLAPSTGFEVTAGKAKWMLFINKVAADAGILRSINKRKMIMGLLSRWVRETDTYSPQYVVLTNPAGENEVKIMVVRSDGEVFYSGTAAIKGDIMSFAISDIERPGTAPTRVSGRLTLRGIELNISIPVSKRKDKRMSRMLEREELYNRFSERFK